MSNLLNDTEGRLVVLEAQRELLRERLSRFFKRNLVIDYEQWSKGLGEFDLPTLLGDLNEGLDDELRDLYRLLGHVGGLQQTVWDEIIHVNPATGSDITGTGDTAHPYASLWFLPTLPRIIANHVIIVLWGDVDYDDILYVSHEFRGNGGLSFVGYGAAPDPAGGVLNGTLGGASNERNTWETLTLSVAPTAPCAQYFIRMTDGAEVDNAVPINTIAGSVVWGRQVPMAGVNIGDAYTYAIPARTLTIEGACITAINGGNANELSSLPAVSRINFINLNIDIDVGTTRQYEFVTQGAPMGFWFCRILAPAVAHSTGPDIIFQNSINRHNPSTATSALESAAACGIANLFLGAGENAESAGLMVVNREDTVFAWDDPVIRLDANAKVFCVDCMARWEIKHSNVELRQCSAASWWMLNATIYMTNCAANPAADGSSFWGIYAELCRLSFNIGLFMQMDTAIVLASSFLRFQTSGGDSLGNSAYDYCVDLTGISNMFMLDAWQGTAPTINDIIFNDPAAPIPAAFPAADAVVTDAILNNVMRT